MRLNHNRPIERFFDEETQEIVYTEEGLRNTY